MVPSHKTDVERRRVSAANIDVGHEGREARLANLDVVLALSEADEQLVGRATRRPAFAVNQDYRARSPRRLNSKGERAEGRRIGRWRRRLVHGRRRWRFGRRWRRTLGRQAAGTGPELN